MKKRLSLVMALTVLLMLTSCGSSGSSTPAAAPASTESSAPDNDEGADKWKIGIEIQTETSEWHLNYAAELKEFWEEQGADVMVSSSEMDVNKEITDVENFVSAGCDAIFVVPNSYDSINSAVQDATKQGVHDSINPPQTAIESDVGSSFDHYKFGWYVGDTAADWLLEKGFEKDKVAIISYGRPKQELVDRYDGMIAGLQEKCPDIQIVSEGVADDMAEHANIAESALLAHPDLRAFVCLSDALSILETCKVNGYNTEDFGIFASEEGEAQYKALKEEECYRCTVSMSKPGDNLLTSQEILKALKGEPFKNEVVNEPGGPVTKENVDDYYIA